MNFKIAWRPGAEVREKIVDIQELWSEAPTEPLSPATIEEMRRDMFELVGMVKGLMAAIEIVGALSSATPEDEV